MLRRWSLGVALSIAMHVAALGAVLAWSWLRGGAPSAIDIDVTGMRMEELEDLPLGAPRAGTHAAHARSRAAAPPEPTDKDEKEGTLATREDPAPADDGDVDGGAAGPTDLKQLGPAGSRFTMLLRLDRLKDTPFAEPVDTLLLRMPDRRDLLDGTGLSLYDDFEALLVATPNPLDYTATFLAARHHVGDGAMRAAIDRGARATGRVVAWRTEGQRPWGERRVRAATASPPGARDERIIAMPAPGLVVVTPPAYRELLLSPVRHLSAIDGGATARESVGAADGDAADAGGRPRSGPSWSGLLRRIDAEDGLLPANAVALVRAVDLFKAGTASWLGVAIDVPRELTVVLGIDPAPFLEVTGEYADEASAERLEASWPGLQRKLRSNPYVVLGGFSAIVAGVTLTRDASRVVLHVSTTAEEAQRILGVVAGALAR